MLSQPKPFGSPLHFFSKLKAVDAILKSGIVVHHTGGCHLSARRHFFQDQNRESASGAVESRRISTGPPPITATSYISCLICIPPLSKHLVCLQPLFHRILGRRVDHTVCFFSVFKEDQSGNGIYFVLLSNLRKFVNICF